MGEINYLRVLNFFILTNFIIESKGVILEIPNGKILGAMEKTQFNNNVYHVFKSIRYGEAKRFELAKPAKPWKGVYNALFERPVCFQLTSPKFLEDDDCLFLNVYVPKISENSSSELLPVMFWVHGGFFFNGDSRYINYGPDYILDENVIVVTLNFRLGIFGFLSTGDEILPGNLGLKDAILGLQWVQDNIIFFGGDPKNVTIFGESAGAAMVSYLTLTPLTQGYFKRAIIQSGSALAQWSFQRNPMAIFRSVARHTPCVLTLVINSKLVVDCMKTLPPSILRHASKMALGVKSIVFLGIITGLPFVPVIEKPSKTAVLTTHTYTKLLKNNTEIVPMIVGVNSEEALFISPFLKVKSLIQLIINLMNDVIVPNDMFITNRKDRKIAADKIQKFYFKKGFLVRSSKAELIRFASDNYFVRPWRQYVAMIENKTPTYCLIFSYKGKLGYDKNRTYDGLDNTGHAEDLNYLFRNIDIEGKTYPEYDYVVRKRMIRLWTNFAKFGNPTPYNEDLLENVTWHTSNYNGANNNCLDLGYNVKETQNFREEAYRMWKSIYDTIGNPNDTY